MSSILEDILDMSPKDRDETKEMLRLQQVASSPSESLASYVVLNRTLNMEAEFAKKCMVELMRRRELGDDFAFEEWIEEKCQTVKVPTMNLIQIKNFL